MLEKMGSVTTFSVANSVKRGMVIFFGAVAMGTPIGFVSAFGAAVAVLGTAAYWVSEKSLSDLGFLSRRSRFLGCRRFCGVANSWSKYKLFSCFHWYSSIVAPQQRRHVPGESSGAIQYTA